MWEDLELLTSVTQETLLLKAVRVTALDSGIVVAGIFNSSDVNADWCKSSAVRVCATPCNDCQLTNRGVALTVLVSPLILISYWQFVQWFWNQIHDQIKDLVFMVERT